MPGSKGQSKMSRQKNTVRSDKEPGFGIRFRVAMSSALVAALVIGCGGWAAQAKLSGAVIAPGQVAVKRQVKEVQHRDGGIVAEILVENGDGVTAGQTLVRLDETETRVELSIIRSQLAELMGTLARLKAERDGLDAIVFPEGFNADDATAAIAAGETKLFTENRAMRESQKEQLLLQIAQLEDQISGLEAQLASNESERTIIEKHHRLMTALLDKGLTEGSRVRDAERDLARIDGARGDIVARIAQARGQISETEVKLIGVDNQMRTEAQAQVRDLDARIAELNEREVAAMDRLSRMELKAPVSGIVYDLQIHTVGGVIGAGQTVASLVPDGEDMNVEVRIAPGDIDQVFIGQPTRLRFSAFNQRTTPELEGAVLTIAAAATRDAATGRDFYLATIAVSSDLTLLGDNKLVPGMPVEVLMTTEERTALSYLVKPLSDQMAKAFREQ